MVKDSAERIHCGLYAAQVCLLALAVLTAAAVETPKYDQATQQTNVAAGQAPGAKPDSSQTETGPASTRPAPAKADTQEEPSPNPSGLSAEAQESYRAQMREVQEQLEEVNVRAKTATTGLIAIESDMASQGLGLRSDVLEAEARMSHLIGKAQRDISSGDAVSAEQDLQMAGYAIDFIERFLGR